VDRREYLLNGLSKTDRLVEIGPSYNPLAPKAEGWCVFTIDHDDRRGLIEKYANDPSVSTSRIEEVDFVWRGGSLSDGIPAEQHGTFDAFLASHVIEHTTDVVSFLFSAQTLVGERGRIILAVPDKRKCFDLFRPFSSTGDAVVAYREKRARHTAKVLFDYAAYAVNKDGRPGWSIDNLIAPQLTVPFADTIRFLEKADAPDYVDAHQWVFTPASFELMVLELSALGFVDLRVENCREAAETEFYAWLRKGAERLAPDHLQNRRRALMNRMVVELADQSRQIADSPLALFVSRVGELDRAAELKARLALTEAEVGAIKDMLAEVRQSRDDWKAQAERLARRRPWWQRLVG
jgi:hypothetical protein